MYKLSEHLTYKEAIVSLTAKKWGIDNTPNNEQLLNMVELAKNVFEPIREHFKVPLFVSSMFRSEALNKKLKGAEDSQHCKGEAMDIDADMFSEITNEEIFFYILHNLDYDQLILEDVTKGKAAWVHVSYKKEGNRKEALFMYRDEDNKPVYKKYSKESLKEFIKDIE